MSFHSIECFWSFVLCLVHNYNFPPKMAEAITFHWLLAPCNCTRANGNLKIQAKKLKAAQVNFLCFHAVFGAKRTQNSVQPASSYSMQSPHATVRQGEYSYIAHVDDPHMKYLFLYSVAASPLKWQDKKRPQRQKPPGMMWDALFGIVGRSAVHQNRNEIRRKRRKCVNAAN